MEHKIKNIVWQETAIVILAFLSFIIYKDKALNIIFSKEYILEILLTIYIPSTFLLIYHLIRLLKSQLNNPLLSIKSKLLEKTGYEFSKNSVEKISSTFATLLENEIQNILWEFEHIELKDLEQACLHCSLNLNPTMTCNNIPISIRKYRRIRVTTIANSLILQNNFFSKNEYLATETRRPSNIIDIDRNYYENQKKNLTKFKPTKACRLLILSKNDLKDELLNKRDLLTEFVNYNNIKYTEKNKVQLKIIAHNGNINEVFSEYELDSYYDFAISKKRNQITVFAQNPNNFLSSYDSSYENSRHKAETFYNAFMELFNYDSKYYNGTVFSDEIHTIEEVEVFINSI